MSYSVRRLGPGDLNLLRELNTVFGEAFDERDTYTGSPPSDDYLASLLGKPHVIPVVALNPEGRVVGGLVVYEWEKFEQERSELYIYDLAVLESHRRRGIARALIHEVQRIARERNAWTVVVQADLEDDPAIALYRSIASEELTALHFDIPPASA